MFFMSILYSSFDDKFYFGSYMYHISHMRYVKHSDETAFLDRTVRAFTVRIHKEGRWMKAMVKYTEGL